MVGTTRYVPTLSGAESVHVCRYTLLTILKLGFVAGEMKNPTRDVPRVLHSAMAIVMTGFVLVNIALYVVLPIQFMREHEAVAVVILSYPLSHSEQEIHDGPCQRRKLQILTSPSPLYRDSAPKFSALCAASRIPLLLPPRRWELST